MSAPSCSRCEVCGLEDPDMYEAIKAIDAWRIVNRIELTVRIVINIAGVIPNSKVLVVDHLDFAPEALNIFGLHRV